MEQQTPRPKLCQADQELIALVDQRLWGCEFLKSSNTHPQGIAVWSFEFAGDQSKAARLALSQILTGCQSNEIGGGVPALVANSHPIYEQTQSSKRTSTPTIKLDESSYPYRLSSGERVSFSHSRHRVVIAIASADHQKLGVDTELRAVSSKLSKRFFTPAEHELIQLSSLGSKLTRQTLWMIKEAYAKACGVGLFEAIATDLSAVLMGVIDTQVGTAATEKLWCTEQLGLTFCGSFEQQWAVCFA